MDKLKEKASYVRGLMDGMGLDESKKETKLFSAIIDFLEDSADEISNLNHNFLDLCDEIDDMNEDIAGLEDEIYGDDNLCCCSGESCCEDNCDCGCQGENCEGDVFYKITCPECEKKVKLSEKILSDKEATCTHCGALLDPALVECCEEECE